MAIWLTRKHRKSLQSASKATFRSPIPIQVVSNGEYLPTPQTAQQRQVEREIMALAERYGKRLNMGRRQFLRTSCGMVAALMAMNKVYGALFAVDPATAAEPEAAEQRLRALSKQFIFDVQLHFVHDDYSVEDLLELREAAKDWNPDLMDEPVTFEQLQFENFLKEVFLDSQTTLGLLSGAPADDPEDWFLSNDQIAKARAVINSIAGSRRLFCHSIITPGRPGWLEDMDRAIEELQPDSWKGYTIGDPLSASQWPWRLDDEELVYPAYEKMVKAGIRNVCIHKGLLPEDYESTFADTWQYANVDDLGKAAKDWPQLNFIIYHSALKPIPDLPEAHLERFERTGRIDWVTDLAEIPQKHGVENVYAELGTSFATSAVTHPRHCAALLGTLIKGLGLDHVLWGTDSVWYGSPQWQIEAFRHIEIPEDMQQKHGFSPLGPADGPVKNAILGLNAARLYGLDPQTHEGLALDPFDDRLAAIKRSYEAEGRTPSHLAYGFISRV